MKLTPELLLKVCPKLGSKAKSISDAINKVFPMYNMDSPLILTHVIPNLLVECQEFTRFEEGLNYQSVALMKLFSRKRISMGECINYGRTATHKANQVAIANCIYGREWGRINLGNTQPNDGYNMRGGGPLQCTGRDEYQRFTNYYNNKLDQNYTLQQVASMLRDKNNLEMGLHFACWFFSIYKNIIPLIAADKFEDVVRKVNGGTNGLPERIGYYTLCKKWFF